MAKTTFAQETDIRPVVRTTSPSRLGLWAFVGMLAIAGVLFFQALDARRMQLAAPATALPASSGGDVIASPPPLVLPSQFADAQTEALAPAAPGTMQPSQPMPPAGERVVTRVVNVPGNPAWPQSAGNPALQATFPRQPSGIYEADTSADQPIIEEGEGQERVAARRWRNPSLTVPKGTVIPAVLETAIDSTRPGAVRAIVSRDVMGFDGTRVLIPRGSRLYGEYGADMNYGQNRALIRWTRLLRPDAVTIDLDSPAADPLGRAGVGGKVDTHFFARFGSSILQSVLDIGVGIATRSVTDDAVILALPQGNTPKVAEPETQVRPTLKVKHGTSVSVFVARDLDFASVDS